MSSTASPFGVIVPGRAVNTECVQLDGEAKFVLSIDDATLQARALVFVTGALPVPDGFAVTVHGAWPSLDADAAASPPWQYLGFVTASRPSALLELRPPPLDLVQAAQAAYAQALTADYQQQLAAHQHAVQLAAAATAAASPGTPAPAAPAAPVAPVVGVAPLTLRLLFSLEKAVDVQRIAESLEQHESERRAHTGNEFAEFATSALRHFYNYVQSFSTATPTLTTSDAGGGGGGGGGGSSSALASSPAAAAVRNWIPTEVFERWHENFSRKLNNNLYFWRDQV